MQTLEFGKSILGAAIATGLLSLPIAAQAGDNGKNHDFNLSIGAGKSADARDVGLPTYPGARPHKDNADDDSAAHIWAVAGPFGLKVAVLKLESNDPPDKVAAFYRPALAKYGALLDCSANWHADGKHASGELNCDSDSSSRGEIVFKAGKDMDQHVVAIKPNGQGSIIDLVYVRLEGFGD
jgi:hypothetical protein